jgi:hypothetical protein
LREGFDGRGKNKGRFLRHDDLPLKILPAPGLRLRGRVNQRVAEAVHEEAGKMQEEPVSARLDMMIPPRASGGPEFILQEAEGPSIAQYGARLIPPAGPG